MSVQRQIVPVPIATGIDTNADPKQLQAKLLICENGYVARQGVVQKRHGLAQAAGSYTGASFLTEYRDRPMLLGQNDLRVYDGGSALTGDFEVPTAYAHSTLCFTDVEREHLSADAGDTYYFADVAETAAIRVISYTAYRPVATVNTYVPCLKVFSKDTGLLLGKVEGPTDGTSTDPRRFRLVEAGGKIVAVYQILSGGSEYLAAIEINGTTGAIGSPASTAATHPAMLTPEENLFDACLIEGDYETTVDNVAAVWVGIANDVHVARYVPGTGWAAPYADFALTGTCNAVGCSPWGVSLIPGLTPGLVGIWYNDRATEGNDVLYGCCIDAALAVVAGDGASPNIPIAIATAASSTYRYNNLPACESPSDADLAYVFMTRTTATGSGSPLAHYPDALLGLVVVEKNEVTGVLSVASAAATIARKVKAASRPFASSAAYSAPYLLVQYQAEAQAGFEFYSSAHYFVMDAAGQVVGKSSIGQAGPWTGLTTFQSTHASIIGGHYSNAVTSGSEHNIGALKLVGRVSDAATSSAVPTLAESSYQLLTVTTAVPSSLRCIERGNLHVPASCPYFWDGQTLVEDGFLFYPEGLGVYINDGSGKLANGETYLWCATYEWMDANGFMHSSAPSPPIEAVISAPDDDGQATVDVPYLSLTRKANVRVVLWRTKGNGQIFYRVASAANSVSASVCTFTDNGGTTTSDDDLTGKPYLYTTGGRVENIQPQPHRTSGVHQDRHFIVDREAESTHIWYSKSAVSEDDNEERGFEHNGRMLVQVPPDGGRIMALSSYLDRLIIFKATRIYVVTGTGLDDTRQGAGYSNAILLDPAIGCVNEKSVVQVPTGVMFLSERGIYQIDQSLQRMPVGLPVKDHTDSLTIVAANVIPEKGYVVFSTTGVALVFSYVYGVWSTFTNHVATDAVEWNGALAWLTSAGYVRFENTASFLDRTLHVSMRLRTGVLSFGGIFGFERIFSIGFVGQALAACLYRVKTAYDAAPYFLDNQTISGVSALGKYFDVAAYLDVMSDASYLDKTLMVDAGTSRQKCSGVMNEINDEQLAAVITVKAYSSTSYYVGVSWGENTAASCLYTSDASATITEIVNGLVAAINSWSSGQSPSWPVLAANVNSTLVISATGTTAFTVTLPLIADPPAPADAMVLVNGSATDDEGYSLSSLAYEIGLLPGAWPSSVIGTARGM